MSVMPDDFLAPSSRVWFLRGCRTRRCRTTTTTETKIIIIIIIWILVLNKTNASCDDPLIRPSPTRGGSLSRARSRLESTKFVFLIARAVLLFFIILLPPCHPRPHRGKGLLFDSGRHRRLIKYSSPPPPPGTWGLTTVFYTYIYTRQWLLFIILLYSYKYVYTRTIGSLWKSNIIIIIIVVIVVCAAALYRRRVKKKKELY